MIHDSLQLFAALGRTLILVHNYGLVLANGYTFMFRSPRQQVLTCLLFIGAMAFSTLAQAKLDTSQASSFAGTLPCADCPGIDWHLDLWPDGRFHLRREYQGWESRDDDLGRWRINPADESLLLFGGREAPLRLAVTNESTLRLLSPKGEAIESTLPYELTKLEQFSPAEISLRVGGEFSYFADAASVKVCRSGSSYPVLMEGNYLDVERLYLKKAKPYEQPHPVFVQLEGTIVNRQAMDGEGPAQSLRIDRLVTDVPGLRCERAMSTATLPNTYWRLLRLNGNSVKTPEVAREIHLVMHDSDGSVSGFAGCNRFKGSYSIDGKALSFSPLASTMMACPEAQMQIEQNVHQSISRVTAWRLEGQTLELYDIDGGSVMVFDAVYLP